jgi:LCP family protein required for cell wall assembly
MGRTNRDKKFLIRGITIFLVVVFLVSALMMFLEIWESKQGKFPESNVLEDTLSYNGSEYVQKKSVETFLVMGLDKYDGESTVDSYNNDKCADFIMLFVFDNDAKKFSTIHINRDTMASINVLGVAGNKVDTVTMQITLAHTYGNGKDVSCRNTAESVSGLLMGMKVNHYLSVTMDSVSVLNNLVGGVEVTVLDDFSDVDESLIKGSTVTLTGEQALMYVRSRSNLDDSTNVARMERQKQYINAFYQKFKSCMENDEQFIVDASMKVADYIISDRSITQLQEITKKINEYEYCGIVEIEGESKKGENYMEFYPDDESIKKLVVDLFYMPKN